eukprot:CAMPEP_0197656718 /NCGR_PEP_ID=MMETSP1338-20131121/43038_1 /TAXON_ID=43686 ORGANISM="Pelagodinium beii, Strain RCC1491" /NCGR_SAMPLE_ID=MMETSP1338 /ASSEMBLY_ACC=CAM_ASM_000754 /LENGTH=335 /DNA_ID=CAMNT_0043232845 /DNA_START=54 /DNA_END=1061 /DNA_ORIENTATION=-
MAPPARTQARRSRRAFTAVACAALAVQLVPEVQVADLSAGSEAFAAPAISTSSQSLLEQRLGEEPLLQGASGYFAGHEKLGRAEGRTARQAAAAAGVGAKVLNAMGAGAVASVIQAALSAVGEPIVNRVLVKRMKVMDAIKDVSPAMMLDFFKTTLTTNFLKFPFFEAINAFCAAMPINSSVRGFITGIVFTTATLPVTNYRYRKSMQLEVNWSNIYEAYFPTLIRDIVYGIARNYCTIWALSMNKAWTPQDPMVLFFVVILGCLISAPFNEWRGFLLQSKGQELTFSEFFKPANFVRSTGLGAFKQGLALGVGYWCAPPAKAFVMGLIASIKGA